MFRVSGFGFRISFLFLTGCASLPTAQSLDTEYRSEAGWRWERTEHLDLAARRGSAADRDLDALAPYEEGLYADLRRLFRGAPSGRISCVFFETAEEKAARTGRGGNAHADYARNAVFAVYSQSLRALGYHEMCHLFDRAIRGERGRAWAVVEGLAVALDGRWSEGGSSAAPDLWAEVAAKEDRLPPVADWPAGDPPAAGAYAWAGSFVQYLLTAHGWDAIDRYRRTGDAKGAFGADLEALDRSWRRWVVQGRPIVVSPCPGGPKLSLPPDWKRDPMGFAVRPGSPQGEGSDATTTYLHRDGGGHLFVQRHPPGTFARIADLYLRRARTDGTEVQILFRGPQAVGTAETSRLGVAYTGKDGRPRRLDVYTWDRPEGPVSVGLYVFDADYGAQVEAVMKVIQSVEF